MNEFYNDLKKDVHNVSYWLPKIQDNKLEVSNLLIPKTFIKEIPLELFGHIFMDKPDEDIEAIYKWVKEELIPSIPNELRGLIFIKNGAFSNKFDFSTCSIRCNILEIARSIAEINYASLMFDTGGNTEIVIRERIPFDESKTMTIYNGMPLRNEYRVFYDFDNRKVLYSANYWDWNYCHDAISRNATDKLVYETIYNSLAEHYVHNKEIVEKLVAHDMQNVDLSGIWSIDVLEDENGMFWLIDMALGYRSAYWNPEKAGVNNG